MEKVAIVTLQVLLLLLLLVTSSMNTNANSIDISQNAEMAPPARHPSLNFFAWAPQQSTTELRFELGGLGLTAPTADGQNPA